MKSILEEIDDNLKDTKESLTVIKKLTNRLVNLVFIILVFLIIVLFKF